MNRKIISFFSFLILLAVVLLPSTSFAGLIAPQYMPGPEYPGTNIEIKPGDIIYSPKGKSTYFVGHLGIVGTDYRVYHSHPLASDGSFVDTIDDYIGRFEVGDEFSLLRPRFADATKAAKMAMALINDIQRYALDINLGDVANNYCSKFVWQAYYYSSFTDITGNYNDYSTRDYILPSQIKNASGLYRAGSFNRY